MDIETKLKLFCLYKKKKQLKEGLWKLKLVGPTCQYYYQKTVNWFMLLKIAEDSTLYKQLISQSIHAVITYFPLYWTTR